MRLSPPHPWNTQDSHSHTSPLIKTPPHQKVQNCYWNYLMTNVIHQNCFISMDRIFLYI